MSRSGEETGEQGSQAAALDFTRHSEEELSPFFTTRKRIRGRRPVSIKPSASDGNVYTYRRDASRD